MNAASWASGRDVAGNGLSVASERFFTEPIPASRNPTFPREVVELFSHRIATVVAEGRQLPQQEPRGLGRALQRVAHQLERRFFVSRTPRLFAEPVQSDCIGRRKVTDLRRKFISFRIAQHKLADLEPRESCGQQGVAIQLIDQSPIAFDDVIFRDLVAAHAAQTDQQVIGGSGANGQVLGVDNTPGITTIAVTNVDIKGVYSAIANGVQLIHTSRYLPPEVIVMHPRRWGWFLSLLDASQRPLFLGTANAPMNVAGVLTAVPSQQVVGSMHGLPVVTDPNIPVDQGTGNNEDPVFVVRASDLVLWEGGIRARVMPETRATTLTVLLQIYSYSAFTAARYPQSVVEITGLAAPTF